MGKRRIEVLKVLREKAVEAITTHGMNPQELVNQDVKANANNFRALMRLEDLTINVRYYLTKIQFNSFKLMHFFRKKEVQYAA